VEWGGPKGCLPKGLFARLLLLSHEIGTIKTCNVKAIMNESQHLPQHSISFAAGCGLPPYPSWQRRACSVTGQCGALGAATAIEMYWIGERRGSVERGERETGVSWICRCGRMRASKQEKKMGRGQAVSRIP